MNAANKGLKFGSFEDLSPEDHRLIVSFLTSGSQRVKLYWERPVNKFKFKSSHASTATQTPDVKFVKPDSGGGDGGAVLTEKGPATETPVPQQSTPSEVQAQPPPQGGLTGQVQPQLLTQGGLTGQVQSQPPTPGRPTDQVEPQPPTQGGPPPPTQARPEGGETVTTQQPSDQPDASLNLTPPAEQPDPAGVGQTAGSPVVADQLGFVPQSVHPPQGEVPQAGPPGIRTDPAPPHDQPAPHGQQEAWRPDNHKFEGVPRSVPDNVIGGPDTRDSGPRQYPPPQQPPQLPPQHVEVSSNPPAGPIFDNYFPPQPPAEFVPQALQQGVPLPGTMQNKVLPQGRPPHVDLGYAMAPRWSENDQVRGHVEDGVYTRPGSSIIAQNSPATNTGNKTYERRNKKRRPPDYYKRYDNAVDPNQVAQNMGGIAGYPPMSSVRPSLETPSSGSFVGVPGSGSVITSQYGQQVPAAYATMLNTSLMAPLHTQSAVMHMQFLQQQQQQAAAAAQRQAVASTQQQFLAQLSASAYQTHHYLQHATPSPMFQTAASNNLRPASLGQSPPGRPLPLSPVGLSPSHGAMTAMGRSPPRTSPMAGPPYSESQHHGYHPQQASPTVPQMTQVSQGPLQPPVVNNPNNYNPTSANQVHKEVPRTGGRPLIGGPPIHTAAHPAAMSTFIGPPLHQQPTMVPKVPHPLPAHRPGSQHGPPVPQQGPPIPAPITQAEPKPVPTTSAERKTPPVLPSGDIQVGPPAVVKCPGGPAPAAAPTNPPLEKPAEDVPRVGQENLRVSPVDEQVTGPDAEVSKIGAVQDARVDNVVETSSEKKEDDRPPPKPFTFTFGTVQDIETMKAQPVPKDIDHSDSGQEGPVKEVVDTEPVAQSKPTPKPEAATPGDSIPAPTVQPAGPVTPTTSQTHPVKSPKEAPKAENPPTERPVATVHPQPVNDNSDVSAGQATRPTAPVAKPNEGVVATPKPVEGSALTPKPAEVATPKPAEVPSAWGSKPKSWASLFGKGDSKQSPGSESPATPVANNHQAGTTRKGDDKDDAKDPKKPVTTADDNRAKALGEFLLGYTVKYTHVSLQPRGLFNRSNWCYINATLQALLACPALYQLLKALPYYKGSTRGPSSTPVIDNMVQFVNEFTEMAPQQLKFIEKSSGKGPARSNVDIRHGTPFEPVNILQMLQVIQGNTSFKHGHQEDAEEFMSCILNALHDEMVACMNAARADHSTTGEEKARENGDLRGDSSDGTTASKEDDEDQWEQVGPKNKSVVTRNQAKLSQSPISEVFGGQMRSIFHQQGQKESATLQPFFTLQLDIQHEKVWTVMDALEVQASKETIHGYTDSTTKQEVEAYRRLMIDELPPVLILHLKCFIYLKTGGAQKLIKQIDFSTDLTIAKELMSPNARSKYPPAKRNYELFAVVNHHGTRVVGGHYTADILHPGLHTWVRFDDSMVKVVTAEKVTQFEPPRFPYLLYFRRKDLN